MALSKRSFTFFLVPKQWKVTNIRTKFFKNSSFWLKKSLKLKRCWGKPPQTFCLLILWGPAYTFWVIHVWSHDGLWELPCAGTGMSGPGQSRRGNWGVFRRPKLLGGPRIHKNLNHQELWPQELQALDSHVKRSFDHWSTSHTSSLLRIFRVLFKSSDKE